MRGHYLWRLAARAQLASQPRDVNVERVVVHDRPVRPGGAQELVAGNVLGRACGERGEQAELGGGEVEGLAVAARAMAGRIEAQRAGHGGGLDACAPDERVQAGDELVEGERLRHVVVAAGAEAREPV